MAAADEVFQELCGILSVDYLVDRASVQRETLLRPDSDKAFAQEPVCSTYSDFVALINTVESWFRIELSDVTMERIETVGNLTDQIVEAQRHS